MTIDGDVCRLCVTSDVIYVRPKLIYLLQFSGYEDSGCGWSSERSAEEVRSSCGLMDACTIYLGRKHALIASILSLVAMLTCGTATSAMTRLRGSDDSSVAGFADSFVREAAQRFNIPEIWISAVMHVESKGDQHATSHKGAMGLMQIMPKTYEELRIRYELGPDPYNGHDNILAGAAYLRELHDRFGPNGFLSAYNAGPERYLDYLTTGRPLPGETVSYVEKLASLLSLPSMPNLPELSHYARRTLNESRGPIFVSGFERSSSELQDAESLRAKRKPAAYPVADLSGVEASSSGLAVQKSAANVLFVSRSNGSLRQDGL